MLHGKAEQDTSDAAEPPTDVGRHTQLQHLASRLKPPGRKGGITLRHSAARAELAHDKASGASDVQLATKGDASDAVGVNLPEATQIHFPSAEESRTLSGDELEQRALECLKSIQARRAEEAKARRIEKEREKQVAKDLKDKALQAAASAKAAAKGAGKGAGKAPKVEKVAGRTPKAEWVDKKVAKKTAKSAPAPKKKRAAREIIDANKNKTCPKSTDKRARDYKTGRIYIGPFAFRCVRKRGDYYTERQFSHTKDRGPAWKKSLKAIDDYCKSVK